MFNNTKASLNKRKLKLFEEIEKEKYRMKNMVIIGHSSGIGAALSELMSAEKTTLVYGTYCTHQPASVHENIFSHHLDVLSENPDYSFLPDTIHGLAYCVGAINLKPLLRCSNEDFLQDYRLQVLGVVTAIRAALPALKKSGNASVVLFSSVAVQTGFPFHSLVSASKGAIEGITRALAAELAPSIRVNCIAPSLTQTPLAGSLLNTPEKNAAHAQRHPLKKIGEASDIAAAAAYLLSAESKWVTGQVLKVDGGMSTLRV